MGILGKFNEWLHGHPVLDPTEHVELIVVSAPIGPMTVVRLREEGFDASGHEAFNVVSGSTTNYRIVVPRHEVQSATEALQSIL